MKRQCCLQGGRTGKSEIISRNPSTVVIEDNCEPRLGRFALLALYQERQQGMISLPHLIGSTYLMAINHVKLLSIDFRPLMSKRHQSRIKLLHNALDGTVTGCLPPLCFRHLDDFPM